MMSIDANAAVKWVLPEPDSATALALFVDATQAGLPIVVPPLFPIEATNVLRRQILRHGLAVTDARRLLERFLTFPVTLLNPERPHLTAFDLAVTYDLPATYDAHYLALAQLMNCPFWTADQNLVNALRGRFPLIRWLGNYTGPQSLQ